MQNIVPPALREFLLAERYQSQPEIPQGQRKDYTGDLESLGRTFTRLEMVRIYSEDKGIWYKLSSIKSLTELYLEWGLCNRSKLIATGVELLTNLSALEIFLSGIKELTPNFMEMLCTLSSLRSLSLNFSRIEDRSIEKLSVMTNLTRLDLCYVGLASVKFLSGLTNLEVLHLENPRLHYLDVSSLSSLVHLTRLQVEKYWSKAFDALAELKNLTGLDMQDTRIHVHNMAPLTGLSKLTHLDLSWNPMTDAGVRLLTGLTSLKRLFLNHTEAKNSIQILVPLTGLEVLQLDSTPTKRSELVELSNLVGLKEVCVDHFMSEELELVSAALPHIKFKRWIEEP